MAATGEEATPTKEGVNLLGKPKYKKTENGRFRCVQTGHELLEKDKEVYSQSKRCRLGLIDHALSHNKPPLNLFDQDPNARSKVRCKLTGDVVNKTEEHIWKHINGRRFLNKLEEKEREIETGSIPEEGGQTPMKENGEKAEEKKKKNKKKKKKKKKKNNKLDEKETIGEDVSGEVGHENDEDVKEDLDFWMPPDGERWDFDDGGDRWGSDEDSEEEKIEEEDPLGEVDEDGENNLDDCMISEVSEDDKNGSDTPARKKRKPEELSSNGLPSKKKKKKTVKTTSL